MNKNNNIFTEAASSLDYSNIIEHLVVGPDLTNVIEGMNKIPLEEVSGAIDKFEEETKARKKDIEEFDEKLKIIRKQFYICMSIFGSLTLFLLFGFIYCMMVYKLWIII